MFKHLEEQNISYLSHFCIAIKAGIALIIHAFYPDILQDYASKKISKNK